MRPSVDTGLTLKKGTWTAEEDRILKDYVDKNGEGKWNLIPLKTGLNRCRKSCRLRWLNYLSPNIKRGHFEEDEIDLIRRLHKLLGNKWSLIAGRIPGRTSNDVKNYWNTYIRSRSSNENNEPKEDTSAMVTVIKPQPHTFSKPLDCNPPPAVPHDNDFDTFSGLFSSPVVSDDMIKEYLDELHYDNEIGWSLNDHAMNGRVLDVEQRVSESSFFDLPIEDGMIKEYLDELPYDNEIGWSLDDHAMKSRVLDVEQKVSESGYFDLPIEESTWDFSDLINI